VIEELKKGVKSKSVAQWLNIFGPLIGLALIFGLFSALKPDSFPTLRNIETIARQTAIVGIAALGMTLVIISGGIDLSAGSVIALSTVAIALILHPSEDPGALLPLAAAMGGVAVGALCGLVNGVTITRLRMVPFIVTLGMLLIVRGAAKGVADEKTVHAPLSWLENLLAAVGNKEPTTAVIMMFFAAALMVWLILCFTGTGRRMVGIEPGGRKIKLLMVEIGLANLERILLLAGCLLAAWISLVVWRLFPPGVLIMLALAALVGLALRYTAFGRHVFAIGSNEQTAMLCGVPVGRVKVMVYALCGAFAGMAGVMQFSRLTVGDPTVAIGLELNVIAAVVIGGGSLSGGEGSVLGSIVGALIMTIISSGCSHLGLPNWVQEIVTGSIIVAAVAVDRLRHGRQ